MQISVWDTALRPHCVMDTFKHHIKIVVLTGEVCPHFIKLDSTVSSGLTRALDDSIFPVKPNLYLLH